MTLTHASPVGGIRRFHAAVKARLDWRVGFALVLLWVLIGIELIKLNRPTPATPMIVYVPCVVHGFPLAQPGSSLAAPMPGGATSPEAISTPRTVR